MRCPRPCPVAVLLPGRRASLLHRWARARPRSPRSRCGPGSWSTAIPGATEPDDAGAPFGRPPAAALVPVGDRRSAARARAGCASADAVPAALAGDPRSNRSPDPSPGRAGAVEHRPQLTRLRRRMTGSTGSVRTFCRRTEATAPVTPTPGTAAPHGSPRAPCRWRSRNATASRSATSAARSTRSRSRLGRRPSTARASPPSRCGRLASGHRYARFPWPLGHRAVAARAGGVTRAARSSWLASASLAWPSWRSSSCFW